MKYRLLLLSAFLTFASGNSHALAGFSRACSFVYIPPAYEAAKLFETIGKAPIGFLSSKLYPAPTISFTELAKYWVLESITTDYGSVRYYLAASTRIYRLMRGATYGNRNYQLYANYDTGWDNVTLQPEVTAYGTFKTLFTLDRSKPGSIVYSARAGNPDIIEYIGNGNFSPGQLNYVFPIVGWNSTTPNPLYQYVSDDFLVYGNHYIRDTNGVTSVYTQSEANGCNFTTIGFGLGDR